MPRVTSYRVDTKDLQGEGSFVVFRRLGWKSAREVRKFIMLGNVRERPDLSVDEIEKRIAEEERLTSDCVLNGILEWNWEDEHGKPIAIPTKMSDLDDLTADEVTFLIEHATGSAKQQELKDDEAKN